MKTFNEVLTAHCLIGTHAVRMGRNFYDYFKNCRQPEEKENIEHLFCHCIAYNRKRNDLLGNYILSNLSDIVASDIRAILKFVLRLKWLCHEEFEK